MQLLGMKAKVLSGQFHLGQSTEYATHLKLQFSVLAHHMDKFKVNSTISSELHTYNHSSFYYSEPALGYGTKILFH